MSAITKLLTFDEFRAATGVEADALRQQRAFFEDMAATQEVLGSRIAARGWVQWPDTSVKGWGVWDAAAV